ncbi:alpha/beta fold hydrolase [Micromonospora sp. WMMD736]|uniref:alpha/beta fold hydrolase n=1 Tax=Micromonospora sp. WMMD736 TaxID=3404112 RepID=UPI003B938612
MPPLTLADGRTLAYDTYGDPDGLPVIFSHGFADSRVIRHPDEELTRSLGVWMIAADQPGVGGSAPQPGRRMVDWGADMEQLADQLGLGQFAVAGHSGGSPHALSIAVHMPDRVTHGVLASPVGPLDRERYATMLAMTELKFIVKLRRLGPVLRFLLASSARRARKDIGGYLEEMAKVDASDAATFLSDPAQREMFEANFTAGIEQGCEGMYEMTMALWQWGFEIGDVRQPFGVYYGDADDIISPEMPKRVAEQLPDATATVWPGAGHYGFVDRDRWSAYLSALTARAG